MFDFEEDLGVLDTLTERDVIGMFGPADVAQGRLLVQAGDVIERELFFDEFLGNGIEAIVIDGENEYLGTIYVEGAHEISSSCDCARGGVCEHTAAVLFAWLQEPDSFVPETAGDMLDLLQSIPALRDALAAESPGMGRFLEMLGSGEMSDADELLGLAIDELEEMALPQSEASPVGIDPAAMDQTLRQMLQRLTVAELRNIGKRRGFALSGTRKDDIIDQLVESLRETVRQPDLLAGLTDPEHELLRILYTLYGVREYLTWNEIQWAWEQHDALKGGVEVVQGALTGLEEYGFLYRCNVNAHAAEEHFHWLPHLIGVRLPVVRPAVKKYPGRKIRRLSQPEPAPSLPATLASLVAFAAQHPLRLREQRPRHQQAIYYAWLGEWDYDLEELDRLFQGGRSLYGMSGVALTVLPFQSLLTDETLDQLARWLGVRRELASWLTLMAVSGGILTQPAAERQTLSVQHEAWKQWYDLSPDRQVQALFEFWRRFSGGFTELSLAQQRKPSLQLQRTATFYQQFTPADLALEFAMARGFVTRLLQDLPANVWYDWASFAESARKLDSHFLHSFNGSDVWGLKLKDKGQLDPSKRGDWERGYRPVLAAYLEGPLRWLGAVEVGYDQARLAAFRVTPAGAWLLRGEGQPPASLTETAQRAATWLDDRRFRLPPGSLAVSIFTLADGVLATPTQEAFVYELSNAGVQEAFAQGIEPAVIASFFEQAGLPLPDTTQQQVEDLWSRFGHVHLYEKLTVLELTDDLALRELLANTTLRRHIVHQFSPRLVVVEDSAVEALVEEMIKHGYTPKVEDYV